MLIKFITQVSKIFNFLNFLSFLIMTVGVLIAVFSRYLFRNPIPGGMELACFAMLWCAFLQTGNAYLEDKHVAMSLIRDRLSGKKQTIADIIINMIVFITVLFLTWWSIQLAFDSVMKNWHDAGALALPMVTLYGVMCIGLIFLGIVTIAKIIQRGRDVFSILGKNF